MSRPGALQSRIRAVGSLTPGDTAEDLLLLRQKTALDEVLPQHASCSSLSDAQLLAQRQNCRTRSARKLVCPLVA